MLLTRLGSSPARAPSLAALVAGQVREREPIEAPTRIDRVRGAGYGFLTPFRHLIELAALGAITSIVGAPAPVTLLAVGAAAAGSALIGLVKESLSPTRPATLAATTAQTAPVYSPLPSSTPAAAAPWSDRVERLMQSEWVRAAGFIGLGCATTAGVLVALDVPRETGFVLTGGLPLALAGLFATRKLGI